MMENKIRSIGAFIDWMAQLPLDNNEGPYAYRGFRDHAWSPQSSLYREIVQDGENPNKYMAYKRKMEALLLGARERDFDRSSDMMGLSDLQLMVDLQHNHARTMLIDFSRNPLVALWFACAHDDADGKHGRVLAIDTSQFLFKDVTVSALTTMTLEYCMQLSYVERSQNDDALQATEPKWYMWKGQYLTERTRAQDSLFVFSWPEDPEALQSYGQSILVDRHCKQDILEQLDHCFGIEAAKLFPDRHGYARWHRVPTPSARQEVQYGLRMLQQYGDESYERALMHFKEAIALDPEHALAHYYRGYVNSCIKQYQAAIADFNISIELDPNFAFAYGNRGIAQQQLGQLEEAITDYDRAIALDKEHVLAHHFRGIAKQQLGRFEEAIVDYDQAISLDSDDASIYIDRGDAKEYCEQHEEAIADYNRAIEIDPTDVTVYRRRAIIKRDLAHYEEMITDYDRVIAMDPTHADDYHNRGFAKQHLQRVAEAILDYTQAIKFNPNDAAVYHNRSVAHKRLGHSEAAQADLAKAQSLEQLQNDT